MSRPPYRAWMVAALLLAAGSGRLAPAQTPAPAPTRAPTPAPSSGGGAVIEDDTSGMVLEWGIVAVGLGVAVAAVCRSSRRN